MNQQWMALYLLDQNRGKHGCVFHFNFCILAPAQISYRILIHNYYVHILYVCCAVSQHSTNWKIVSLIPGVATSVWLFPWSQNFTLSDVVWDLVNWLQLGKQFTHQWIYLGKQMALSCLIVLCRALGSVTSNHETWTVLLWVTSLDSRTFAYKGSSARVVHGHSRSSSAGWQKLCFVWLQ